SSSRLNSSTVDSSKFNVVFRDESFKVGGNPKQFFKSSHKFQRLFLTYEFKVSAEIQPNSLAISLHTTSDLRVTLWVASKIAGYRLQTSRISFDFIAATGGIFGSLDNLVLITSYRECFAVSRTLLVFFVRSLLTELLVTKVKKDFFALIGNNSTENHPTERFM
ncbi:hypothetical protein PV327_011155, partial [Microctonus hyperodae]